MFAANRSHALSASYYGGKGATPTYFWSIIPSSPRKCNDFTRGTPECTYLVGALEFEKKKGAPTGLKLNQRRNVARDFSCRSFSYVAAY